MRSLKTLESWTLAPVKTTESGKPPPSTRRWRLEPGRGVLLMRPYWNASLSGQGHVAILLPSGYVLQSFPNMHGPGLNWDYTIEQSNAGDYYTDMVHPENWSEYEDPEDDW